jgi:hypothetical protein
MKGKLISLAFKGSEPVEKCPTKFEETEKRKVRSLSEGTLKSSAEPPMVA